MSRSHTHMAAVAGLLVFAAPNLAYADPFHFSTGDPNGKIGTASRPSSAGVIGIETADDFVLTTNTQIDHATFTGLLPTGFTPGDIGQVDVEVYRSFPGDSTNPPSGNVPTRVNSPSDVTFATRSTGDFSYSYSVINSAFTVNNSVVNGINPIPNQTTGGEGSVTGQETVFTLDFTNPLVLSADHYFFVPQVQLSNGTFLWLSTARPIVSPATAFSPDRQTWIRNDNLSPDWLRVGTDIIGNTAYNDNAAFTLDGQTAPSAVPEPSSWVSFGLGIAALGLLRRRARRV